MSREGLRSLHRWAVAYYITLAGACFVWGLMARAVHAPVFYVVSACVVLALAWDGTRPLRNHERCFYAAGYADARQEAKQP